jgi:CDP-6-deoxy-D-xylo-4-hexulose-3-dehydrase
VLFGFSVLCSNTDVRDAFAMYLESRGVEVRPIICGNMARQPAMANVTHRIGGSLSGADEIMACGLYWGLHPGSTDEEIEQLGAIIREFDWW